VRIYTKRGDDGTTGLLYGGRLSKDDLRVEAYGTSDEAVAALGMARASCSAPGLAELILRLQREMFVLGAELATAPENHHKLKPGETKVVAAMVDGLEALIDEHTAKIRMPEEFIVPGETPGAAALDLARAIVRRCERRCVALAGAEQLADGEAVRYLNRLADLLFVLARYEEGTFRPVKEG